MERVNYHCHCQRCGHASGTVEDYAAEAVRAGLTRLGFSDHLPFPGDVVGFRMPYAELEDHLREVAALRERMAGTLTILQGFEGEYFPEQLPYYRELLDSGRCDYLILGQHFFTARDGARYSAYDVPDTALYADYCQSIVEAMRTGCFVYAAHPDLIFINDHPWDDNCERACDALIEGALRYGFALECNANGYRRGVTEFSDGPRYPYPHERLWDKIAESGVGVFLGSDCHEPQLIWDEAVERALAMLESRGVELRTRF